MSCPSLGRAPDFLQLLHTMGVKVRQGVVVNFGAAFIPAGSHSANSNIDESWNFFFRHASELGLKMLAVEGNRISFEQNLKRLQDKHSSLLENITSVNAYLSARTVHSEVTARQVPRRPLLLKVDIDSIDLPVAAALLHAGMRPHLLWAEHNARIPLPVKFTAAERIDDAPRPSYGMGMGLHWTKFHCNGASLAMWHALGTRYDYQLAYVDHQNVLLVPKAHGHRVNATSELACFARMRQNSLRLGRGHAQLANFSSGDSPARREQYADVLSQIATLCKAQHTPFALEALGSGGECACPNDSKAESTLCSCDLVLGLGS